MALGKTDWFTLAELVVVISVIAVLFTIGTFSYLWNVQHAENSVRLSNLSSLSAGIQDARQRNGRFPAPDDWVAVTYSGAIAWKQGVAWQSVAAAVGAPKPHEDPHYWALYAYSVSSDWRLFQLASAFDWSEASNGAVPVAYADTLSAVTAGNYNGLAVAASDGLKNWIVAAPSIVLGSLAQPEMAHPSAENRFVFDGWNTLPNTYSGLAPRAGQAGPAFPVLHVYYWTGANRYPTDPEGWSSLSAALATAYSGTAVSKILPDPAAWECELAEFWRKALTTVLAWSSDARRFAQERVAKVGAATCLEAGANRQVPCTWSGVPSGAVGTGLFEQTWNGHSWTPSVVPALSYWAGVCGFVCAAWRTWNGSSCIQPSCWTANGVATVSAPSWAALCSVWTGSVVANGAGTFTWTCSHAPAAAANCSAPVATFVHGTAYAAGQSFTYVLPSGTSVTVNVTGTGVGTVEGTKSLHTPACSEDDIAVWGTTGNPHVWAACNAGATTAYSNQSVTLVNPNAAGGPTAAQKAYMGAYYQWGRNIDVTTGATVAGPLAPVTAANAFNGTLFITNGTPPYDWVTPKNDNLWGGVGSTTSTGTHSSLGSPVAMRGPCAAGYHVPTAKEWCDAIFAVSPTRSGGAAMTCSSTSYQVEAAPNKFMTTLKLPLAGLRNHSPAEFGNQGLSGHYWASSTVTVSDSGYTVSFSSTHGVRSHGSFPRAGGFTVRCLKD